MASASSGDTPPPTDLFAAHQQILRERLRLLLEAVHPLLRSDVMHALEAEGKLFSQPHTSTDLHRPRTPAGVWPLLTVLVAQHVSPSIGPLYASSVAVAVECFVCAIDVFDDIIDEDQTPTIQTLGVGRAVNVATALLILAQQAILSLQQQSIAPELILRLLDTFQESAMVTVAGQHLDLLAEQRPVQDFTIEECINIAAAKAGSIMRLACRLGALCAGADDVLCEQFSELGKLLGIVAQLDNDSHDLYYVLQDETSTVAPTRVATRSVKSDLVRGKKTLPVVLAAKMGHPLQNVPASADKEREEYLRALHEGIVATWGICLLYRERARDRLREVEAQQPVAPALRFLLGLE